MSDLSTLGRRLRDAFRRRERALTGLYIAGFLVVLLLLGVAPGRAVLLGNAQRVVNAWDGRWTKRVEHGEMLLAAGLPERAAEYLTVLDTAFPARHVKHRRDRERVRVLRALAASHVEMGNKREALDALRRLVAFDPRDFLSHHELAMAALQFDEVEEARLHFIEALRIHPGHLPSLRTYAGTYFDAGDYATVVAIFEQYLSAFAMHELELQLGDSTSVFLAPMDGRTHPIDILTARPAGWRGQMAFATRGVYAELASVEITPPTVAGELSRNPLELVPDSGIWTADGSGDPALGGGRDPALVLALHAPDGMQRMTLHIRVPKPVDPMLWAMVEKSYRNILDMDGFDIARSHVHVLPSVEAERFIVLPE